MDDQWWSVGVTLGPGEAGPLSRVAEVAVGATRLMSIGKVSPVEGDDIDGISFELRANSAQEAAAVAASLLNRMQEAARIRGSDARFAWAVPLQDSETSSRRFIDAAHALLGEGEFELAVVSAHIYLEVQLRAILETAAEARGATLADFGQPQKLSKLGSWEADAAVVELLGVDPASLNQWREFRNHRLRRNAIVHEGQSVGEAHARDSIRIVHSVIVDLTNALKRRRFD